MSRTTLLGRAGATLVASAVTVSLILVGGTAQAASADRGAGWLAGQLNKHGLIHNPNFGGFDDYGLTIDTTFALKAIGGHRQDVARARAALSQHVDSYTTGVDFGSTAEFAGADAKLLVLAQQTGGGARDFGGTNLVSRLNDRVIDAGASQGRIQDVVDLPNAGPDSANVIGQIFAARGLLQVDGSKAASVLKFLLAQQCGNGFFRLNFNEDKDAAVQGCTPGDDADTDVTALAVVQLSAVAKGHPGLKRAIADAVDWLKRHQHENGSFGGAGPTAAGNANSTGLGGWALMTAGKCARARGAAGRLARLQVTGDLSGTPLAGERGAIAYNHAAKKAAKHDGIDDATRDQWRRATSQAAPALLALAHCES